jgi:hypothetical protein
MATTEEMRTCRAIKHSWDAVGANKESRWGYLVMLRCDRCGTIRNDIQNAHGELIHRYYQYPDGYRDADIRIGNADDRRAWLLSELLAGRSLSPAPVVDIRRRRKKQA